MHSTAWANWEDGAAVAPGIASEMPQGKMLQVQGPRPQVVELPNNTRVAAVTLSLRWTYSCLTPAAWGGVQPVSLSLGCFSSYPLLYAEL